MPVLRPSFADTRFNQQIGAAQKLDFDGLQIDLENRSVTTENGTFELPPKEFDRIIGLEKGSDDYITKPFSPKEMVLRVNNIIKRAYKDDNNRISIDGYELDEEQRKIYYDNNEIELTTKEFDLLMMFIKNKGIAFSRDKILENVWDENYFGSDRVVDDTLRRLRKKLPNLNIHTIYGYGYRLG